MPVPCKLNIQMMSESRYLPDGEWQGFYLYGNFRLEHPMQCNLIFNQGLIQGYGVDDIAPFGWQGTYSEKLTVNMTKSYTSHIVHYHGYADENGIWGTWKLFDGTAGGFHIWPIQENEDVHRESIKEKKNILIEEILSNKAS